MRKYPVIAVLAFLFAAFLDPFADRVGEGNKAYNDGKYQQAEKAYSEAEGYLPSKKDAPDLAFNKGDARFKLEDYDGAIDFYKQAIDSENRDVQKKALFNIGNAYAKKGDKVSAADAYMAALRIDPKYEKAKKNLENLYRKDDKKDQNKDQNKDQQDKNKDQQQQDQQPKISKQDAERMLQAIQNNEKDIQEKMKQEKAKAAKVRVIKNW